MDCGRFWSIIDASRKMARGSQAAQFDALEEQLRALPTEEVVSFQGHFSACMARADNNDVYAAAAIIDGFWVSDDAFIFFLEWLISQGEEVFENALRDPESLAEVVEKGEVCAFEGFGYVAARVWEEKTGQSAERMPVERVRGPEEPQGPAWKDDADLQCRFPKLWGKFFEPGG